MYSLLVIAWPLQNAAKQLIFFFMSFSSLLCLHCVKGQLFKVMCWRYNEIDRCLQTMVGTIACFRVQQLLYIRCHDSSAVLQ